MRGVKAPKGGFTLAQGKRSAALGCDASIFRGLKGHLKETTGSGFKRHPMPRLRVTYSNM